MWAVIWRDLALDALADVFVAADLLTRDAIEQAVTRLNARLASDPETLGESRPGPGRRIAYDSPRAIRFTVYPTDRVVRVTRFWSY